MPTMLRWVLIGFVYVLVAGTLLYGLIAFVTGNLAIMEWSGVGRGIYAFIVIGAAVFMTIGTGDIEEHYRRKAKEQKNQEE